MVRRTSNPSPPRRLNLDRLVCLNMTHIDLNTADRVELVIGSQHSHLHEFIRRNRNVGVCTDVVGGVYTLCVSDIEGVLQGITGALTGQAMTRSGTALG
jgi:hypothetical protein